MAIRGIFRSIKGLFAVSKKNGQRAGALFLLLGFVASSIVLPPVTVYAAERADADVRATEVKAASVTNSHAKPLDPGLMNKPMKQDYASAAPVLETKNKPSADYFAQKPTGIPGVTKMVGNTSATSVAGTQVPSIKHAFKEEELTDKRTADSTTSRNKDGSYTVKKFATPKFFKKDNKWTSIDTTLVEDKNAADSGNILGKALGQIKSWAAPTASYTIKENDWQARFLPSDDATGMVRIKQGNSQVSFSPVNAKTGVAPVITTDKTGEQTVHYYDLWPGVNVEYNVKSAELKENIILKYKDATANFAFKIDGASLKKTSDEKSGVLYTLEGALGNEFAIAPLSISLNKYGFEAEQPLTQTFENGQLKIAVDHGYLARLPNDAYPVTVDPTTVRNIHFGNRVSGNYLSFKSDGFVCYSNQCNPLAGSVLDSNSIWRAWRGAFYSDYNEVKGHQLTNATLHLTQRLGLNTSGTADVKNIKAWHAGCLNYTCLGLAGNTIAMGTVGDIDVTNIYQTRIAANDWGAWLMLTGEETTATTYKNMDPDYSYVQFTYNDIIPSPSITSTTNNQVYIDPQVSFSATPVSIAGATLQYNFCVSTGTLRRGNHELQPANSTSVDYS